MENAIISVHVIPKSARNQLVGWVHDANGAPVLKIKIAAPPEDGKANAELIRFLAKEWKLPKTALELISGDTSRHKRLRVCGLPVSMSPPPDTLS